VHETPLVAGRWVDVVGPEEPPERPPLHPLLAETLHHRERTGKFRQVGEATLFVLRALDLAGEELVPEEVVFVVAEGSLLTYHERPLAVVDEARRELETGRVPPTVGAAVWRLADHLVGSYLAALDALQLRVHEVEGDVLLTPAGGSLERLLALRRQLLLLRTHLVGAREILNLLSRLDLPGGGGDMRPYLLDVYDHVILAQETCDTLRDLLASALEAHLSVTSNRLAEVMKTLTIIATIMMPLTVITGFYGMNFHMPETDWAFGYPFVLLLMASVTSGMLLYFRRRRWIG
jgi:magnesium transporter